MNFLLYFAQTSLYAAIMWSIYSLVWRNRPLHTSSRVYLLASLVLPAVLPLIHIPVSAQSAAMAYGAVLPELSITAGSVAAPGRVFHWPDAIPLLYGAVSLFIAALYGSAYVRINMRLRRGRAVKQDGYTIITDTAVGPGTLGRRIFFPAGEVDPLILRHELAHIHAGHRYDSILLQAAHVIFWISPAHWLIGRELKTVHEFSADRIASRGADSASYVSLLLSQCFGAPGAFSVSQSFFDHSLKRRIMMLQKIGAARRSMLLFAAIALTAGFTSTVLLAQTKKPARQKAAADGEAPPAVIDVETVKRNTPPKSGEILALHDGTIAFKTVDQMPRFNGSLRDWMIQQLQYPAAARAKGEYGKCMVQFTVSENGQIVNPRLTKSSSHPLLDAEALRVISEMPPWKPGLQHGKPVPVLLSLPIFFSLNGNGVDDGC